MPTTAETARPYRHLTTAPNTGPTVPANAKLNTTTTAETGLRSFPAVRRTRPAPTSPTALPKSVPGLAIPDMKNQEILVFRKPKPVLITVSIHLPEPLSEIGIAPM